MKKMREKTVEEVDEIICDCCAKVIQDHDYEINEVTSISYTGGYHSVFGDGMEIEIDLCQQCFKYLLGKWVRTKPCPWLENIRHIAREFADGNLKF